MLIMLAACNSVDTQEVSIKADQSFLDRDFTEFNKQYNILKKKDSDTASTYLNKLKEDDVFKTESYDTLIKIDEGIILIDEINKNIPSLSDFAKTKSDVLKDNKQYLEEINKIIISINSNHIEKVNNTANKINYPFILIDNLSVIGEVIKNFNEMYTDANSILISIEDIKVPDNYLSFNKNLIESLTQYKESIKATGDFLLKNQTMIITVNDISNLRNSYALLTAGELERGYKKLTNDIQSATINLKQRVDNFKF